MQAARRFASLLALLPAAALHGFCHTVYRIACAANAFVIQCLAGGGEGLVLGAGQPGVCHIVL